MALFVPTSSIPITITQTVKNQSDNLLCVIRSEYAPENLLFCASIKYPYISYHCSTKLILMKRFIGYVFYVNSTTNNVNISKCATVLYLQNVTAMLYYKVS